MYIPTNYICMGGMYVYGVRSAEYMRATNAYTWAERTP